jgi:ribosomal protein L23
MPAKNIIAPRATEKSYAEQTKNTYVFSVPLSASKQSIEKFIEKEYSVTVIGVRVLTRKGKAAKFSRGKRAYPGTTFKQDKKYAYVTLKADDKIKVFEEDETKDKKADKKADKKPAEAVKAETSAEKTAEKTKKAGLFTKRRTGNRGDK